MKRVWVGCTVLGSMGLLTVIVLTVIEGVKYRVREEQGLNPIYAPDWVAAATSAGLMVFALAMVGLAVTGVVGLVQHRQRSGEDSLI